MKGEAKRAVVALLFAAAAMIAGQRAALGEEQQYSEQQFEQVMRGYLLLSREDYRAAAGVLHNVGVELGAPEILGDAAQAAINLRDINLAREIGESWLAAGGGTESLQFLTKIRASTKGLDSAIGLLSRLAEEGGPEAVFDTVIRLEGDIAEAMRVAHPLHLRDSDYHAYLAILMLRTGKVTQALEVLEQGLAEYPDSPRLLLVRLYFAEQDGDDYGSISLSARLAEAAGIDLAASVMVYERWRAGWRSERFGLPGPGDFAGLEETITDEARLHAGRFYLRNGDPEAALKVLATVPRNSPSWGDSVRLQVVAHRTLDDSGKIFELLETELKGASPEFVPTLAGLYAAELDEIRGPMAAFEYLDNLERGGEDPSVLYSKSLYAERLGLLDEAEAALRLYIKARPDESDGYNALGYMFADNDVNLEEALSLIEHALSIEPYSAAIVDSHGWVLYRLGNLVEARGRIEESLRLMGEEPHVEVMAHYGEILWELGEREHAVLIWRAAWGIDSEDEYLVDTLERYGQRWPGAGE